MFYYKENLRHHKPDLRVFNQPLNDFCALPNEAVYIGDSLHDAICSKQAGTKQHFRNIKVDFFADNFPMILDYILKK